MKISEATPGTPCWVELGTSDVPKAAEFYGGLFGWNAETDPRPEAGGYTMCSLGGAPVAALTPLYAPGQPVAWTLSFASADADATAVAAQADGGTIIMAPMDVFDLGRFSVVQDPTGAFFAIWQPMTFQGFAVWDEPGTACWVELATREVSTAKAFYTALYGWTISSDEYPHIGLGDRQFGGIQDMNQRDMPAEVPAHWLIYFKATDVAASAAKAAELGAKTLAAPFELPGTGHFAVLQDPQGAVFALYQEERAAA